MISFILFVTTFINVPSKIGYHNKFTPCMHHYPKDTKPIVVHGGSLRTWSFRDPFVDQVQVVLNTEGRPMDANIELWNGPNNTPFKVRVYSENGKYNPFNTIIETPRGPNTISVSNSGQLEFPFISYVFPDHIKHKYECSNTLKTIQGGSLRTYPFGPNVDSVQILLKTDGRPLNSRLELLQGPNNNKQVIELYTDDGCDRPFSCIMKTPGYGNIIRIVNTSPIEFPIVASAIPYEMCSSKLDNQYRNIYDSAL